MPDDKHTWAFYYFLKRQGDRVSVRKHDGLVNLTVRRNNGHS